MEIKFKRTGEKVIVSEARAASLVKRGKYEYIEEPKEFDEEEVPTQPKKKKKRSYKKKVAKKGSYKRRDMNAEE